MSTHNQVALITGSARRIGATIAVALHGAGFNVVVHYRDSHGEADALVDTLNQQRPNSAICLPADLNQLDQLRSVAERAEKHWGRLDALVNNASSFYATPFEQATEQMWEDLLGSNLKAPYFLSQSVAPALIKTNGTIINIADIHADRPLHQHSIYCIAKAGNLMLTKSLAKELAPHVRVNGIAPGAILWPTTSAEPDPQAAADFMQQIPLARLGAPEDIAEAVLFLVKQATYMTGHVISVDGGRQLT